MKQFLLAATIAALVPAAADAAVYNFNVNYSGGGVAALAGGSDDPLAVTLADGDSFTYRLTALAGGEWTALSNAAVFPLFSLYGPFNSSNLTFTLDLNNNGSSVFNFSEATGTCCAHIGTNTVALPTGLVFDEWELAVAITTTGATGPAISLLPWPGLAPEVYSPSVLSYSGAVPEPASWAMMIAGFGLTGAAMRRRRVAVAA